MKNQNKWIPIFLIPLLVLVVGLYYVFGRTNTSNTAVNQPEKATTTATSTTDSASDTSSEIIIKYNGLSLTVPDGWTVNKKNYINSAAEFILRSPDYEEPGRCNIGGYCNLPSKGAEITLGDAGSYTLINQGKYQEFVEDRSLCSNCKLAKVISIDGKDVIYREYSVEEPDLGEGLSILGMLTNNTQFEIDLISKNPYSENKEVFEKMLSSIHFAK